MGRPGLTCFLGLEIDLSPERQKDVWLFAVVNPAKFIKKRVLKDE